MISQQINKSRGNTPKKILPSRSSKPMQEWSIDLHEDSSGSQSKDRNKAICFNKNIAKMNIARHASVFLST